MDAHRILLALAVAGAPDVGTAQTGAPPSQIVEWPAFAGDLAATKYSPLTDINRDNVARLTKAWEWSDG